MRCLEICGISCFTSFPIYSMGHGVPRSSPTHQPPYLYTYRCDYVSTAYRIYSIYQPLHLAYTYISYSFILFYTRYCIIIASALSPARYLVAYPIYIPYILCRYCILYHLFCLSTTSRVFLYLVGIYVYRYYILDSVKCAFSPPPPLIAGAVHIPILTGEKRASLGFTHRPIKVHWPTRYRAISRVFHYLVLYTYNQPRHLVPCHPFRFSSILHILYLVGVFTIGPKM